MGIRSEMRLIERALNQGWPVPPQRQAEAIRLVTDVLDDKKSTKREQLAALRVLGALIRNQAATDSEIRKRAGDALRKYLPTPTHTTHEGKL